jgi:threonine dehydrogenase-like Zn-dependent dehydrogenase
VIGVWGATDKFPMGALMNKGMTLRTAQQHGQAYVPTLLEHAASGDLRTDLLATHVMPLEDGVRGYELFKHKTDGCVRSVFRP